MEEEIKNGELEEANKKGEEYLNNWKRAVADLANYKKDEMERAIKMMEYAKAGMIEKILPVFDSIYLAERSLPEDLGFSKGFYQIINQITDFLKKEGIEEIDVAGKPFDPNTMEIVEEVDLLPAREAAGTSGIVADVLQKGYMIEGKVLRPAKVRVTK